MKTLQIALLSAAITTTFGPAAARAADLDGLPTLYDAPVIEEAPELAPVEIGNGWYLRGDLTWQDASDVDTSLTVRNATTSGRYESDGAELSDAFGFSLGAGYRFTDYFRADVTAGYSRPDIDTKRDFDLQCGYPCTVGVKADATAWEVMANAYVDLGTFAGFSPYVGAGAGAVHVGYEDVDVTVCAATTCAGGGLNGEGSWRFAYSLMAGIAYDVTRNVSVDIGYRYLDVQGGDMFSAGSIANLSITGEDDGYDRHTIRAGLRYALW